MAVAFAHYIRFIDREGLYINGRNYQNFFVGETRTFESLPYQFGPYAIVGLSSTRNGDVPQGSIVATPNEVMSPLLAEATISRWLVEIRTVSITVAEGMPFVEGRTIASEIWACTAGGADVERATVTLSSPTDAALREIPGRVLTRSMVGMIPPTGQIVIS